MSAKLQRGSSAGEDLGADRRADHSAAQHGPARGRAQSSPAAVVGWTAASAPLAPPAAPGQQRARSPGRRPLLPLAARRWAGLSLAALLTIACSRPPASLPPSEPAPAAPAAPATEPQGSPAAAAPGAGLGSRTRIAGLAGLRTRSQVVFAALPEQPHRFVASYAFPDRVRFELSVEGGAGEDRAISFRFGPRTFEVAPRSGASTEPEPAVRDQLLRRFELRRAAFLWPDGFEWTEREGARFAPLPMGPEGSEPLGFLVASDLREGRPGRLDVHRPDGSLEESLLLEAWRTLGARAFPARLSVSFGGETVWTETVEDLETSVLFLDALFLPADRLELLPAGQRVARGPVPASWSRSLPLIGARDWASARSLAAAQRAQVEGELSPAGNLDPQLAFDLAEDGRPAAVHWRWAGSGPAPAGFLGREAAESVQLEVRDLESIGRAEIETLRALLPGSAKPLALLAQELPDGSARVLLVFAST